MDLLEGSEVLEHEACESDEVQAREGFGKAFVVADEATEAGRLGERAFDDPAPGQENEAALGLVMSDGLKLDAALCCGLGGLLTDITLVHEGDLDMIAGGLLDGIGQAADLGTIIGGASVT